MVLSLVPRCYLDAYCVACCTIKGIHTGPSMLLLTLQKSKQQTVMLHQMCNAQSVECRLLVLKNKEKEALDYFMRDFQLPGCVQPGFFMDAGAFMTDYFEPFSRALQCLLSGGDIPLVTVGNRTDRADDSWARQAIYNMLCFPIKAHWRPAAILAIKIAQSSMAANVPAWLKNFMLELECVTLAIAVLSLSQKQQASIFVKLLSSLAKVRCSYQFCIPCIL